ncbi:MAG: DUF3352 domain-containing protein [Candidatus Sericytochromatia bacterium]|nr:DUF3352 domain-containing protein [Candidatus Sericytochromatia bacterium]
MLKTYSKITLSMLMVASLNLSAFAQGTPDAYKFVPKDSLMVLDIKTGANSWSVLNRNKSLRKFNFFTEMLKEKETFLNALFDEKVRKNFGDNLVISFSNFDFEAKDFEPEVLLIEEFKDKSTNNIIKDKLQKIYSKNKKMKIEKSSYRDSDIFGYKYTGSDKEGHKEDIYTSFIGNYVVVSNKLSALNNALKSYSNEVPNITYSEDFNTSFNKLGDNFESQAYINFHKLMASLKKSKDFAKKSKDMKSMVNFESLDAFHTMMFNINLDSNKFEVKSYSLMDKDSKYGKLVLDRKPSTFKTYINYIPKNALFFAAGSDLRDAGKNIKDYMPQLKELGLEKMIKDGIGIDAFSFLDNINGDLGLGVFNAESSPLIPGFALFINPKDKAKMITMMKDFSLDLSETDKGNRKQKKENPELMRFVTDKKYKNIDMVVTNENSKLAQASIQPAYGFIGDNMVIASNEEIFKSVVDRSTNNSPDFNLSGNTSFTKLTQMFGESNNSVGYINLTTIVKMLSPMLAGQKDTKDILDNLKKFEAMGFNSNVGSDGGVSSRMILLADIENIDFGKLIPVESFNKAQSRARTATAKANMYTFQLIAETYAVDNYGIYANNLPSLINVSKKRKYFKDVKNPFTAKTGMGINGSYIEYKDYKNYKGNKSNLKGLVVYQSEKCKYNKKDKKNECLSYKIYGLDEKGNFIKNDGKVFYLSNY